MHFYTLFSTYFFGTSRTTTQTFSARGHKFAKGLWVFMYLWPAVKDDWQLVWLETSIISVREVIFGKVSGRFSSLNVAMELTRATIPALFLLLVFGSSAAKGKKRRRPVFLFFFVKLVPTSSNFLLETFVKLKNVQLCPSIQIRDIVHTFRNILCCFKSSKSETHLWSTSTSNSFILSTRNLKNSALSYFFCNLSLHFMLYVSVLTLHFNCFHSLRLQCYFFTITS